MYILIFGRAIEMRKHIARLSPFIAVTAGANNDTNYGIQIERGMAA